MFQKRTAANCHAVYDFICDMENTAFDYDNIKITIV